MGWSAHEVPVQTLILTVTTWCPDISAQDMLCKCGMKGRTDIRTDGWVGWWLYVGAPQGPSVKGMRSHVCHLPAVTEVSVAYVFSPPPQPVVMTLMPTEDVRWVLGRMLSTARRPGRGGQPSTRCCYLPLSQHHHGNWLCRMLPGLKIVTAAQPPS